MTIVEAPPILTVNTAPIHPINIEIKAANSINILSNQFKLIPSCFLVLPIPITIIGTNAIINPIKNGIKNKDISRALFDKNGLAGLIFYSVILILVVGLLQNGKMILSLTITLVLIIIPLLLILFKEKIENLLNKKKAKEKVSIVEKIFELIEMLLSMASNTISFVRLAAFAINHVGLCMAVYILSNMFGSTGSLIVAIIGNGIVIVLEGLIVAIQVLRLEYYELFSRFYSGDGKEYIPIENEK